ncbi:NIPA-like protein 2 isoform X2 [Python bivittatus]|uniref:NIPA-like protein 2 isoform X2 n=1 Tax=Python bivittatus TaxID=176946 RepID=A0A9F5IJF6_PYTBI|nr:NIPA-like protein 2 isoform X2 [Python bivittatus]
MRPPRLLPNATLGGKASSREFLSQGWYVANEQTLLLGILLAVTGNILISISLNLQKYSHLRLTQRTTQKPCYRSKLWWCGIILMGIGEIGNFAAYGFAPVTVVAPLGSVAVIGSAVIAVLFLKENFRSESILVSLTIISVKAVAAMLTFSVKGNMQLTYPIFYLMLILMALTCVFQVKFLNQATEIYGSAAVIPLNYVLSTLSSILAGAIFYQEFQGADILSGFMFLFGSSLTFIGVFIITRNRSKEHLTTFYIDCGHIPGKKKSSTIQPDLNNPSYGSLYKESASLKTPTKE